MAAMNQKQITRYRQQLLDLRSRLRTDAATVTQQALGPSGGQGDGALTNAPMHLGDEGTEEYLHDMNAALLENEEYLVRETRDALRRLDAGGFGDCESCGQPIGDERLEAMPYIRFCVACAATVGSGVDVNFNFGRPRTPRDTLAPEGAMQEDWRTQPSPLTDAIERRRGATENHAAGEAGGGTAVGGLAGSNAGHGDPSVSELQDAAANSGFDLADGRDVMHREAPSSGRSGGAVGGTPARKRAK
jgi:RNA polymerase-binding transcription factor DksA